MCGIAGLWKAKIDKITFDRFVDSLAHRGPDGRGVYCNEKENLYLGHRRLSILDLSENAMQPLCYLDRYWIVFNGEIYNFLELRNDLEKKGYRFKTKSDTEVILAAYHCYGQDCQLKFNGMWAFAIWDKKEQSLFLSRDRFGVKPLHYFYDGSSLIFSSEMKSFLQLPQKFAFDEKMVATALHDGADLEHNEKTLLKGIKRLQAGHCLLMKQNQFQIRKWWETLDHLQEPPKDPVGAFRDLFLDATALRMRSDVPIGSALSGGLDSSSILCALALNGKNQRERQAAKWQHAFVATFPNTSQDELPFAKAIVEHTKVTPFYLAVDSNDLIKNLDEALFQFEEIFEMPIAPWMLYKQFRKKGVVISIDGHGADELLGGYHHHVVEAMVQNPFELIKWKRQFANLYPEGSPLQSPSWKSLLKYAIARRFPLNRDKKNQWLKPFESDKKPYTTHKTFKQLDFLNQRLYIDFHYKTLPTILRNFDRVSMAHGIEIRAPFLDFRLVTLAFCLPSKFKIANGYTKWILREAVKGLVPDQIRLRKTKVGFASPMIEWFSGPLKSFILDQTASQSFLNSSIWQGGKIREHVENCYKTSDFAGARASWEYVQAHRLMEIFKAK